MLSIALTGGIASGKSTVLKMLSKHFPVIDADEIVAKLYKDKKVCSKIKKSFGVYDKKLLAVKIFSSLSKRKKLEKILHPLVLKELKEMLEKFEEKKKQIVFVEVPLLFESSFQFQKLFPLIVCISCSKEQQIARLLKKGFSKKEALSRISSQIPLKQKIKSSDFVIDNSGSLNKTRKQVNGLIKNLSE